MLDNHEEYIKMSEFESDFWWYKTLHNQVINTIKYYFKNKDIKILDAGCGTGGLIKVLKDSEYKSVEGVDISDFAVQIAKQQNINILKSDIKDISKVFNNRLFDVIISNDVLYFLDTNSQKSLINNDIYKLLNKDGILILNIPALNIFKGTHDISVGINHRINKKEFSNIIDIDKFSIEKLEYWPCILSPLILIVRLYERIKLKVEKSKTIKSDLKKLPKILNFLFYKISMFENKYFKNKIIGSSLFIVLKRN